MRDSPFQQVGVGPGDTIWRLNSRRVYSRADIDAAIKSAPLDKPISVSIISQGEHVERQGLSINAAQQTQPSPSGILGSARSHRFRASGWTRHYETFSELLQMIAQLALGLALAHLRNHGVNKYFKSAIVATTLLALGIALTAMRTVLVAFVFGASLIAWRSARGGAKVALTFALFFMLAFGTVVVWQTRAQNALSFADPSASLRAQVARVGFSRIILHPFFGHGMDAMKKHWNEWGFPGTDMIHLHSTPLQLAFDRGLPALLLWLWLMVRFGISLARAENRASDTSDTNSYGILLGSLGALMGFFASSLVNYNFGDGEVALLFWWLMGITVVLEKEIGVNGGKQEQ
jgi:energy-converting hydrogenase Eha subunit A